MLIGHRHCTGLEAVTVTESYSHAVLAELVFGPSNHSACQSSQTHYERRHRLKSARSVWRPIDLRPTLIARACFSDRHSGAYRGWSGRGVTGGGTGGADQGV